MGYDLHIVRRSNWDDYEEDSNITLEEWLAYVQSDNELELTNGYLLKISGFEDSFQNAPGFCNWTGHTTRNKDGKPWLDYGHGMISTKNPDDETIKKMISISKSFDGRVQGDDGEFYDENYLAKKSTQLSNKKTWWKFWQ